MKDTNNSYEWIPSNLIYDTSLRDEKICESEHVIHAMRRTRRIFDAIYYKYYLSKLCYTQ